jgi:DNA mismatch repair protein MutL
MLARAIAQSYGSVLEGGRYPIGVVWLDVPPELVDVNVHPQKAEVRFADGRGLFDAVTRELHASLARSFGLPALGAHPMAPQYRPPPPSPRDPVAFGGAFAGDDLGAPTAPREGGVGLFGEKSLFDALMQRRDDALPLGGSLYGRLRFMGQAHGTFLVCEGEDGLFVLDQHAAAERVTFDRLRRAHAARTVAMQRLLVPEIVELPEMEVARLVEHEDDLARLGVEARAVGASSMAVHAVPAMLAHAVPARIVEDLVAELGRSAGRPFGAAVDLVLATMACHGSVRAGDAVSREEAEALLRALDEVDFAGHCPHGRPLVMRLSWSELERRVGR